MRTSSPAAATRSARFMSHHRLPVVVSAALFLLAGMSCTSSTRGDIADPTASSTESGVADQDDSESSSDDGAADPSDDGSSTLSEDGGSSGPLATVRSVLKDPDDDAQRQGDVPAFTEILEASVTGRGSDVELTLVMSGEIPQQMPDDSTFMIISWNLAGGKLDRSAGFSAQATTEGWVVSSALANETIDYPGSVTVEGDQITLTFPWDFVNGPYKFDWSAASTWSAVAGEQQSVSADNVVGGRYPKKPNKK